MEEESGILVKEYIGAIGVDQIKESWKYAFRQNLIPPDVKGFILDYRKANFNIKDIEYLEIPKFYKEHLDIFGNQRIAIITENSKDVVIPMLVTSWDEGYQSKAFTTIEAARLWVLRLLA